MQQLLIFVILGFFEVLMEELMEGYLVMVQFLLLIEVDLDLLVVFDLLLLVFQQV